jgi:hypothetical protein
LSSVGPGDFDGGVREEFHVQRVFVDVVVVSAAEQEEVVVVGGAAVSPVVDVVGVAESDGSVAAGEAAATIAGGDGTEEEAGDGVAAAAVGEHDVFVAQDLVHRAVTQQGVGRDRIHHTTVSVGRDGCVVQRGGIE